jgi:hypothetical protein
MEVEVEYIRMKHKILKILLHGRIWSDYEKISDGSPDIQHL